MAVLSTAGTTLNGQCLIFRAYVDDYEFSFC